MIRTAPLRLRVGVVDDPSRVVGSFQCPVNLDVGRAGIAVAPMPDVVGVFLPPPQVIDHA